MCVMAQVAMSTAGASMDGGNSVALSRGKEGNGKEEYLEVEGRTRASSLPSCPSPEGKAKKGRKFMRSLRQKLQKNSFRRSSRASSVLSDEDLSARPPSPLAANGIGPNSRNSAGNGSGNANSSAAYKDDESSISGASQPVSPTATRNSHVSLESPGDAGRTDRPPLAGPKPQSSSAATSSQHPPEISQARPPASRETENVWVVMNGGGLDRQRSTGMYAEPNFEDNVYENTAALVNAFGPMRDIGLWYSAYHQQRRNTYSPGAAGGLSPEDIVVEYQHRQPLQLPSTAASSDASTDTAQEGADAGLYETVPASGDFTSLATLGSNVRNLAQFSWYWGPVSRYEAEDMLAGHKDGTFLVRDSSDERYLLSLTFRSQGRTLHTRIEHHLGRFSFYAINSGNYEDGYSSVGSLIERSMYDSQEGAFCFSRQRFENAPSIPVRLTVPYSRRNHVRSLQHICRFVIRQHTRYDLIRELPLPNIVKDYLQESSCLQ